MPLYEYQCDACGFRFEVIQRFSDPPVDGCQSCGGTVRKLLSSPAIQFKGSGWYVTDYARKGVKTGSPEAESAASPGAKGKDEPTGAGAAADKAKPDARARTSTDASSAD